jgi:DNA replication protein DnaC
MEEKDLKKELEEYLRALKLPTILKNYQAYAQDAARSGQSFERFLLGLFKEEFNDQYDRMVQRSITRAKFPVIKDLASFDFSVVRGITKQRVMELAEGDYLAKKESIILIGNPGLGKTHIATGLALAACKQGKRVRFFSAAALVNDLLAADHLLQLSKFKSPLLKSDLIVLDEVGFIPFTTEGAQSLFQFCSDLHERVSMIVTSNLRFGDWVSIFGDKTMTSALLDRLTGRGHILEFIGESYRFRQRLRQEEQQGQTEQAETGS